MEVTGVRTGPTKTFWYCLMVNKYNGPVRVRLFTLNFKRIKMFFFKEALVLTITQTGYSYIDNAYKHLLEGCRGDNRPTQKTQNHLEKRKNTLKSLGSSVLAAAANHRSRRRNPSPRKTPGRALSGR